MKIPGKYDHIEIEKKWSKIWNERQIYKFDEKSSKTAYSIDSPPPYPSSGDFHMGNVLNWTYFDIVARYKRMRGYNVLFPQGWDCHGLPTEVQVEKKHRIRKGDIPREEFRRLCIEQTTENIGKMKEEMNKLGYSIDWTQEYKTMDDDYWRKTQLSFIKLYKKGLIYRGEHPVDWCPRCQTAIAHAEVEYEDREGYLNYLLFDDVEIATTRPELLCACVAVAVHPDDERYASLVGKKLTVPLYDKKVEVITDESVDRDFGTGVVMICTFGDKTDVRWAKKYHLPTIQAIDEKGVMTKEAGKYAGESISECKKHVVTDLESSGKLKKREKTMQNVGVCWRCKTPVEIIARAQWFMDVTSWKDKIIRAANEVKWVPEHMKIRLQNWADSMDWDWVLSRQRLFATPIPVWYCGKCHEPIIAEEDEVPVDPTLAPQKRKCKCGSDGFYPETDVFDTWMDSSITCAVHAGWPDINTEKFRKTFPADLQPNGTDIIRTWDYYLLVRHLALFDSIPYKTVLINGMVVGEDGRKMSKSLGNFVNPSEAREKYGADAVRQWAALGGTPGSDIPFKWKDVIAASRFLLKMWNVLRFSAMHAKVGVDPDRVVDRWLLNELNKVISSITKSMEDLKFDEAMKEIRSFAWYILADEYIELAKSRLYGKDEEAKKSAQQTLYVAIDALARLLAPFTPFFAEEMYSLFHEESVHIQPWPEVNEKWKDESAEKEGALIKEIVSAVRRYKSSSGIPLNAPLKKIEIISKTKIDTGDISGAMNSKAEVVEKQKIKDAAEVLDAGGVRVVIEK